MKRIAMLIRALLLGTLPFGAIAADESDTMGHMTHHQMHAIDDQRTSLGLSPEMKQRQLTNMRSHVEAIQSIVGMLAEGEYDNAAHVAHSRLGLTDEMKKMCDMFDNVDFKKLGLAFHKSGDELGDALQTKDLNKSLRALHNTMEYCVQCHAKFRQ
jgi:cytochrome c556